MLQIFLAIVLGISLLLIYTYFRLDKIKEFSGIGLLALTAAAGGLFYYLFERKKK